MYNNKMLASILFFMMCFVSVAQTDTPPPPMPPPPPGLPIDNGIVLLFVFALVYGIYKLYNISKQPD
jgi:hypothetical protein